MGEGEGSSIVFVIVISEITDCSGNRIFCVCVFVGVVKEAELWCLTFRTAPGGADELIAGESYLGSEVRAELVRPEPNAVVIPVGCFLKTHHKSYTNRD